MCGGDRVFVSYRRSTDQSSATALYGTLVGQLWSAGVFMDQEGIRPGGDFREVITKKIRTCDVILVVIGPDWLQEFERRRAKTEEDYVLFEVSTALRHEKLVIPVLVEGAIMPERSGLPEEILDLERKHACKLAEATWTEDCTSLLRDEIGPEIRRQAWRRIWASRVTIAGVALMGVSGVTLYYQTQAAGFTLGQSLGTAIVLPVLLGGVLPLALYLLRTARAAIDTLIVDEPSDVRELNPVWAILGVASLSTFTMFLVLFLASGEEPEGPPMIDTRTMAAGMDRSQYSSQLCGNGEDDPGEECDFGREHNTGEPGGCSAQCELPWTDVPPYVYPLLSSDDTVRVSDGFRILTTEVTNAQFMRFGDPGRPQASDAGCGRGCSAVSWPPTWPVIRNNWQEAERWCKSIGAQLPSEVQWEIAARGGSPYINVCGNFATCLFEHGVFSRSEWSRANSMPEHVGSKTANPLGLFDAFGNVSEWTFDCHDERGVWRWANVIREHQTLQKGNCQGRVVRGGSVRDTVSGEYIRSIPTLRAPLAPRLRPNWVGFRCVGARRP
ncbi:MAG: SUMF1/EgtB/PvdO family nonheme iron enzyme [Myxococcales bacterium]|nr:SUMF1/EgtB/PvdO family nonheme iron enzyme [Myxococcales bacterium]